LALLWNDPAQINVQNYSQNHIDSHVQLLGGTKWQFRGFYGHLEGHRLRKSRALMDKLHSLNTLPWLCMLDFNEILSLEKEQKRLLDP
jgi:hypothetical protein